MDRVEAIRRRLNAALQPSRLDIIDESARHIGHGGHRGAGHFRLRIVAEKFNCQGMIPRHRMVYDALADLMPGEIHALSIEARSAHEG